MKKLSVDFNNYQIERRKSSILSSNLFLQKNNNIPLVNSPKFSKKRISFSFKKNSKDNLVINKTPISRRKMRSLNPNPLKNDSLIKNFVKKKKLFKTGIYNNEELFIRNMELNIRKKLIDLSTQIEKEDILKDKSTNNIKLTLVNKNINRMSKSLKLEKKYPNIINKNKVNKFPSYNKLNSYNKSNKTISKIYSSPKNHSI